MVFSPVLKAAPTRFECPCHTGCRSGGQRWRGLGASAWRESVGWRQTLLVPFGVILESALGFGQGVDWCADRRLWAGWFWALGPGWAHAEPLPLEFGEPWTGVGLGRNGANAAALAGARAVKVVAYNERLLLGLVRGIAVVQIPRRWQAGVLLQGLLDFLYPIEDGWRLFPSRHGPHKCPRGLRLACPFLEPANSISVQNHLFFLCVRAFGEGRAHPANPLEIKVFLTAGRREQAGAALAATYAFPHSFIQTQAHLRQRHPPALPFRDLSADGGGRDTCHRARERERTLVAWAGGGSQWERAPAQRPTVPSISWREIPLLLFLLLAARTVLAGLVVSLWFIDGEPIVQTADAFRFGEAPLGIRFTGVRWGVTQGSGLVIPTSANQESAVGPDVLCLLSRFTVAEERRLALWLTGRQDRTRRRWLGPEKDDVSLEIGKSKLQFPSEKRRKKKKLGGNSEFISKIKDSLKTWGSNSEPPQESILSLARWR